MIEIKHTSGYAYLTAPRFICVADYPGYKVEDTGDSKIIVSSPPIHKKGDIINAITPEMHETLKPIWVEYAVVWLEMYPDLFKPLKWYENRTIDELLKLEYIEITKESQGYYVPGDKIKVTNFEFSNVESRHPFISRVRAQGHIYDIQKIMPASEAKLKDKDVKYQ